ncbi:DUF2188 domain-containing protein [Mesorhizobium sp. BHbsci]
MGTASVVDGDTIEIQVNASEGSWATRREGATRVGSTHETQATATAAARGTAVRERGEVIIHRPDGRIRDANSYGNDPYPPKG